MGKCKKCGARFWGNPRYCPECNADMWYEEYNNGGYDFSRLQQEGHRLIGRGSYEKAFVALSAALDMAMYGNAEHTMSGLCSAADDLIWLYLNDAVSISDDRITDVLDYFEEACCAHDEKYRENLIELRSQVSKRIPQAEYHNNQGLNFPETRAYWQLPETDEVTKFDERSGYEPNVFSVKHLLTTECFLYLYLNFPRVIKYLQAKDSLNTQMVYEELLPLLNMDLDMKSHGENDKAKAFGKILCDLLEDGFEDLAMLYTRPFDADRAVRLRTRLGHIAEEAGENASILYTAAMAPLMASDRDGEAVYNVIASDAKNMADELLQSQALLANTVDPVKRKELEFKIDRLCAEYCGLYGVGQFMMGFQFRTDEKRYIEGMELAALNGITQASEEMMRSYFYGRNGMDIQPGYAKFYSRLVVLRQIASAISDMIERIEGLEMIIPGTDML